MGGGDDADDVTTEMVGPARTTDAASAMMEAVAKVCCRLSCEASNPLPMQAEWA